MKNKSTTLATIALAALTVVSGSYAAQSSMKGMKGMSHKQHKSMPAKSMGVQKLTVTVNNGFSPSTLNVKAGRPVQLTFDTKRKACASTVVFKDLNITKTLTDGKKTVVTFTPKKAGNLTFACGMGMFKGTVIVK